MNIYIYIHYRIPVIVIYPLKYSLADSWLQIYPQLLQHLSPPISLAPVHGSNLRHSFGLKIYTLWLFNIAMENPLYMEVYSWENHLFRLGPSIPWLCLITRESIYIYIYLYIIYI